MKRHFIVTGTSSGIGQALAQLIIDQNIGSVTGISRSSTIEHEKYQHQALDLSDIEAVTSYQFPSLDVIDEMILINNAGYIGDIKRIGQADAKAIVDTYTINLIAPALLSNAFLQAYPAQKKIILNVSSGAGKRPIDAWGPYCSTKAGLDLLSANIATEQELTEGNTRVFSIAPGVVDTEMQSAIRNSNTEDFSQYDHFVQLKENNELVSSEQVAEKYLKIVLHPENYPETIFSLRDID